LTVAKTSCAHGVRIFPGRLPSRDFEPEFIAVSPDSTRAFVTLQENNSLAVLDLGTRTFLDIVPAGLKDHSRSLPTVETANFPQMPVLGMTPAGQTLRLGGFSGLWFEGVDGPTGMARAAQRRSTSAIGRYMACTCRIRLRVSAPTATLFMQAPVKATIAAKWRASIAIPSR